MASLLGRMTTSLGRWFLDQRAAVERSPGYNLYGPSWQHDKPRWLDRNIGSYRQAFASQVAVYACVMARAKAVSSAPLRVYQESAGDLTEIPNHPLRQLMSRPNPMTSEAEWLLLTQTLMDATGFAAIQKVRNASGQVIQLWHLRSDWLQEVKRNQKPSDWQYLVPGIRPIPIPAEDVLIIAGGPSTDLGVTGMSPIAVALREVGIDTAMTDFLKLFIDQGGVPVYALHTANAMRDQAEVEWHRGLWQMAFGGFRNWSKVPILSGGMDVKKIGSSIDELAYPQLRALTEAHICSVFGVPPIIAGIQAGIEASTYSNYEQARKAFFEDTVASLWMRMDGAFTRSLLPEFSDDGTISLEFDLSGVAALQDDKKEVWERASTALSRGAMTLNQFQAAVGLPGFGEDGDVLYLPISVQPTRPEDLALLADDAITPPQPVPAALQKGTKEGDAVGGEPGDETERGQAIALRIGESGVSAERRALDPVMLPVETRSRIATGNRRVISRLTSKHTPRLRAMFKRQGKAVAAAVAKRAVAGLESRDVADIPWDDLSGEMLRELNALYDAAGKLAASGASTAVGFEVSWNQNNPWVRQTLAELALRVVDINETTRQDVAALIAAGLDDGLSLKDIATAISGLFEETYKGRAMTIARTESMYSYGLASLMGYQESGVVDSVELYDNPDHDEDPSPIDGLTCAQRNGLIVSIAQAQVHLKSEHPNGTMAVAPVLVKPLGS